MELFLYDRALNMLGIVDEISSLVWTRRYWDCGEFRLLVPMTPRHAELLTLGRWVARKDDKEVGQIRYIHITCDAQGLEQIEVQGKFLTHWLGNRLLLSPIIMTAPTDQTLRRIVRETLVEPPDLGRRISGLGIDNTPLQGIASIASACDLYDNALVACSDRAKLAKIGFRIETDLRAKTHAFVVYKGLDRTTTQAENAICIFSPDFDNVLSQEYTRSVENVATAIYVSGASEEGQAQEVAEVLDGVSSGIDRIEFFYDASSLTRSYSDGGVQTQIPDSEYTALLQARGEQVLDQKDESLSFSSVIDMRANLKYKRDFDLGDRVTCLNQRWRIQIDARITEITETYESGKQDLEATFGVSIPSLSEMLKWR